MNFCLRIRQARVIMTDYAACGGGLPRFFLLFFSLDQSTGHGSRFSGAGTQRKGSKTLGWVTTRRNS